MNESELYGNQTQHPLPISVSAGNVFLVDSYIEEGYDVTINADECVVFHNERIQNYTEAVSRLLFKCGDGVATELSAWTNSELSWLNKFKISVKMLRFLVS